jgi:LysM repeat protein
VFVKLLVVAAVAALAVAVIARGSSGAGHDRIYVVRPADTLWSIAARHYAGDPREAVYRIAKRNHLAGSVIVPGERLVLPSAG